MFNPNYYIKMWLLVQSSIKVYLTFGFLITFMAHSYVQETSKQDSLISTVPPLAFVLDAALEHSPLLKAKKEDIAVLKQEAIIQKNKWTDFIYAESAANYGIFDQVVLSGMNSSGEVNTGFVSKSEQLRYYAGLSIKLPLSTFANRRPERMKNNQMEQKATYELFDIQKQIKQMVIEEYFQLKYLIESMENFNEIYQTLEIAYLKAESDLLNGYIDLQSYALISSIMGKANEDYIKAKNNYYAQYQKLQELTGIVF